MGLTKAFQLQEAEEEAYEQVNYLMDEFLLTHVMGFDQVCETDGVWECVDEETRLTVVLVRPEVFGFEPAPGVILWHPSGNLDQGMMCLRKARLICYFSSSEKAVGRYIEVGPNVAGASIFKTFSPRPARGLAFAICNQQGFDPERDY